MEKSIIRDGSIREDIRQIKPMVSRDEIQTAKQAVTENIYLGEKVIDYIYSLAAATRDHRFITSGISTRGSLGLAAVAKAAAFLKNRNFVIPEDIQKTIIPAGAHRLILKPEQETLSKKEVLRSIVESVPVPLA